SGKDACGPARRVRRCCRNDHPSRRRFDPDLRPHGGRHDLARAPTGNPPTRWLAGARPFESQAEPGQRAAFFRFRPWIFCQLTQTRLPRHFLTTQDCSRADLDALLAEAARYKRQALGDALRGRSIALVFFNPPMRTRTSFELGAFHLGGHAIVLQPGKDAWPIEFEPGAVMDGDAEEHIAEVAQVLGRYVDLIGVRAFPKFVDWQHDRQDRVLNAFARHSPVPVINMETITHPCQELAHALALQEHFGTPDPGSSPGQVLRGKKYVLTWTYHPRPLNTAVANSALTIATRMGMDVTLLCPTPEYVLDERYMGWARDNVAAHGGSLAVSHDIDSAYAGADVVYAKSWGAIPYFG